MLHLSDITQLCKFVSILTNFLYLIYNNYVNFWHKYFIN